VAVHQAPREGVFFRGMEVYHHRERLPEGQSSTSIFFEFEPAA
jgi:hypothetical protein